ncbi:MAG: 50S ribosomal protein L18 [Candidatus Aenigmarchaeota archaeon]|nr:50S ribosomal protein L18 [Candidatus Aenigmarchaeota archaeon]
MERRRRSGKTDYQARLAMLKSGKPRLVVRKTANYIKADVVEFDGIGDKVLATCSSKELEGFGWKGGSKNISAAYLTGLLLSKKAGGKDVIVDIGLQTSSKGSKLYALTKGAHDGGMALKTSSLSPTEDRIKGKHIAEYAKKLGDGERSKKFSKYIKSGADPREIEKMFDSVKMNIMGGKHEKSHDKRE